MAYFKTVSWPKI